MLIDTHCHIHSKDYPLDPEQVIKNAFERDIGKLICVGTDLEDSQNAIKFADSHENCWATVGIHPHEAKNSEKVFERIEKLALQKKVVGVGECGLDYYYLHSPKPDQKKLLVKHLELGLKHNLPFVFHVREAFDDFWSIIDEFSGIQGVLHSFTDNQVNLDKALKRNLFIGVNGIATFSKDINQLEAIKNIPIEKLVFETDAPFLTPVPKRGKVNEPKYLWHTLGAVAELRGESEERLAQASTANAETLFAI